MRKGGACLKRSMGGGHFFVLYPKKYHFEFRWQLWSACSYFLISLLTLSARMGYNKEVFFRRDPIEVLTMRRDRSWPNISAQPLWHKPLETGRGYAVVYDLTGLFSW